MLKKILIFILCFMSVTIVSAAQTNKDNSQIHKFFTKNGLNKKVIIGKHTIVLTRIDDRMNRIHFNSRPRYRSLKVEAFDRTGKKMKLLKKGENLSTSITSNHKYMYKTMPTYLEIK